MTLAEVTRDLDMFDYEDSQTAKELYIIDKYGIVHHVPSGFTIMRSNGKSRFKNGIYLMEGEEVDGTDTED
jgi:hypothetical protein